MEQRTEVDGKSPEPAVAMKTAEQVLQVTKHAWLGAAQRESPASKVSRRTVEFRRAPVQHTYLRLLSLEI
jgi:hypothetical protein